MYTLNKPRKQSYSGEEAQVVAYSDTSEMDWLTSCRLGGLPWPSHPGLIAVPIPWCAARYLVSRVVSSLF